MPPSRKPACRRPCASSRERPSNASSAACSSSTREVPTVLRHELYAIPALAGAAVVAVAHVAGSNSALFALMLRPTELGQPG